MHGIINTFVHEWRFLVSLGIMMGLFGYGSSIFTLMWGKRVGIAFLVLLTAGFPGSIGFLISQSDTVAIGASIALYSAVCIWVPALLSLRVLAKSARASTAFADELLAWTRGNIDRFKQAGTDSMTEASIKIALQNPEVTDADRQKVSYFLDEEVMQDIGHKVGEFRRFDVSSTNGSTSGAYNEEIFGVNVADVETHAQQMRRNNG